METNTTQNIEKLEKEYDDLYNSIEYSGMIQSSGPASVLRYQVNKKFMEERLSAIKAELSAIYAQQYKDGAR